MGDFDKASRSRGKIFLGVLFLAGGCIWLLKEMGCVFSEWLFTWPVIVIALGLSSIVKHRFRHPVGYVVVLVGAVYLAQKIDPALYLVPFMWPALIIIFGLWLIFGKHKQRSCNKDDFNRFQQKWREKKREWHNSSAVVDETGSVSEEEFLDVVSVFSGVKKNILTKNFKGGDVVTILGGAEINLSQADITGRVVLEVTQICGGAKIIVPPHWEVISEMVSVLGGIEDKRQVESSLIDPEKILVIRGTSVCGGIDIRSF